MCDAATMESMPSFLVTSSISDASTCSGGFDVTSPDSRPSGKTTTGGCELHDAPAASRIVSGTPVPAIGEVVSFGSSPSSVASSISAACACSNLEVTAFGSRRLGKLILEEMCGGACPRKVAEDDTWLAPKARPVAAASALEDVTAFGSRRLGRLLAERLPGLLEGVSEGAAPASVAASYTTASLVEEYTAFGSKRLGQFIVGRKESRDWTGEDLTAFGSRRIGQLVAGRRWKDRASLCESEAAASLNAWSDSIASSTDLPLPATPLLGDLAISDSLEERLGCSFHAYDQEDLWLADMLPDPVVAGGVKPSVRNLVDWAPCVASDATGAVEEEHGDVLLAHASGDTDFVSFL